ncbi:MAG: PIN/TRAM domain-containing protein [Vulcanimicrobiota bacterium]
MAKIVRGMFYFVFTVFGGLCGYSIARHSQSFYTSLSEAGRITNFAAFILLGILMGITLAPVFSNLVMRTVDSVAVALQKLSLQEVLMGSAGLLFGLIVAFFTNVALQQIDFSSIPAIGTYVGPFLIVLSTIFLGCLGAFFGSRLMFIHSFRDILDSGGARSWGGKIFLLDTSVIIDGRVADVVAAGFLEGTMVVPRFVLGELQMKADSHRELDRQRGRRGLDVLDKLRDIAGIQIEDKDYPELRGVDPKLVQMALDFRADLVTNDYNLQKVAALQNVRVLNMNALAASLKTVYLPGEEIMVHLLREGKESNQGVGFLDDGTMIVVEKGRAYIGDMVVAEVTSVVQTSAGKMIFARFREKAESVTIREEQVPEVSGPQTEPRKSSRKKARASSEN